MSARARGRWRLPVLLLAPIALILLLFPLSAVCQEGRAPTESDLRQVEEDLSTEGREVQSIKQVHLEGEDDDYEAIGTTTHSYTLDERRAIAIGVFLYRWAPGEGFEPVDRIFFMDHGLSQGEGEAEGHDLVMAEAQKAVAAYMAEKGLVEGWPAGGAEPPAEDEERPPAEEEEEQPQEEPATSAPGGVAGTDKLPGPGSWSQLFTGITLPGVLALLLLLLSLKRGEPGGPAVVTEERPSAYPPYLVELSGNCRQIVREYKETNQYRTDAGYRRMVDEMEQSFNADGIVDYDRFAELLLGKPGKRGGVFGRRFDYEHGGTDLTRLTIEELGAGWLLDSAEQGAVIIGEGVASFANGLIHLPVVIGEGWGELIKLGFNPTETINGLTNLQVLKDTGIGIWDTAGRHMVPYEEMVVLFEALQGKASVEEVCWAVASGMSKAAGWVMFSELAAGKQINVRVPGIRSVPKKAPGTPPVPKPKEYNPEEAVERARRLAPKKVQQAQDEYVGEADKFVERMTKKAEDGQPVTMEDLTEAASDPLKPRTLKKRSEQGEGPVREADQALLDAQKEKYTAVDQKVFDQLQNEPKYREIIEKYGFDKDGRPLVKIRTRETHTGNETVSHVTADRDVIYEIETPDGGVIEIPGSDVKAAYHKALAEELKFDPSKPLEGFSTEQWAGMSDAEKMQAFSDHTQQVLIDRGNPEWVWEFRGDPSITDPRLGLPRTDPEWTGFVYHAEKFLPQWAKGTTKSTNDALVQLYKFGNKVIRGAKGGQLDPQIEAALDVINRTALHPQVRDVALRFLGFKDGAVGLSEKLRSLYQSTKWDRVLEELRSAALKPGSGR
ncbi:MAG: hypothetical protein KKF41_16525 [Actinobacteria bacterium]|nr:hypothetical protein [Actinomycetota bacterium]MBU2689185.1 hypothetical protein [Actinomycetota bacterium]